MEVVAEVDGVFDAIVDHRWLSLTNTHWVMGQSAAPTDEANRQTGVLNSSAGMWVTYLPEPTPPQASSFSLPSS